MLNAPAKRPSLSIRMSGVVIRSLGTIAGFFYHPLFGWLDRRIARNNERQLADEVQARLPFLFSEFRARIIPNIGTPFPPRMDGAYVTVEARPLRLLFIRGRGDLSVDASSEFAPTERIGLHPLVEGLGLTPGAPEPGSTMEAYGDALRRLLPALKDAMSEHRYEDSLNRAIRLANQRNAEAVERLKASGVDAWLA